MPQDHYFVPKAGPAEAAGEVALRLNGRTVSLLTGSGVFSKRRVDPGSLLLIHCLAGPIPLRPGDAVCDLGCGYGAIGLAAAILQPECRVFMCDVNPQAVQLARLNAERLGLSERAQARAGDGLEPFAGMLFDRILMNPPVRAGNDVVLRLMDEAGRRLRPGGGLAFVVRTKQGAKTLARRAVNRIGPVKEIAKGGGYRVYLAEKTDGPQRE